MNVGGYPVVELGDVGGIFTIHAMVGSVEYYLVANYPRIVSGL